MTRRTVLLLGVLVAELAAGAVFAYRGYSRVSPPEPDLTGVDAAAADDIREAMVGDRSAYHWAKLGEAYFATGFFPEAEASYRRAAELRPDRGEYVFRHAFAAERLGRLDDANAAYLRLIDRNDRAADSWYFVGKNHLRMEKVDAAADAFAKAGANPAARYELARLHARAGRTADAEAEATRLAAEFPDALQPPSLLYRLAMLRGDAAAAAGFADRFDRSRASLPSPWDGEHKWAHDAANRFGRNRLGRAANEHLLAGRPADAERGFRAAEAAAWGPKIADSLAEAVFHQNRPAEAAAILTAAVDRGGPSFGQLWRLGEVYAAMGRTDDALAAWARADAFATGTWGREMWASLGEAHARRGDGSKADTYRAKAALAAGMLAVDAGKPGDAVDPLKATLDLDPKSAKAWFYLGEAHRLGGGSAEAKAAYQKCLDLDPDHGRALRALALLGP